MTSAEALTTAIRRASAALAFAAILLPSVTFGDESRLVLHSDTGEHVFTVEVVDTPESRAKGLMFRQELADDAGMLFDFDEERAVSFWMQNTFIPLDMIFIGDDGVVKNIHVNARPLDPTSIPSGKPVRFVLEIPGGRSKEIGLEIGDTMEHPRVGAAAD